MKVNLIGLNQNDLEKFFLSLGEKSFRSKQVYQWIHQKGVSDFHAMTNISKELQEKLSENAEISAPKVVLEKDSKDGTRKWVLSVGEGDLVEMVLIPEGKRATLCISSQVGCAVDCSFCATGTLGLTRNLSASEIYRQVVYISKKCLEVYNQPLTNIVFMGMGEPLLNYKNVLRSIHFITSEEGLNMSYKRITLSTSGISKMIRKLADDNVKVNLALSLHAANEELRKKIMPIGKSNTLEEIRDSLKYYFSKTKKKVTYEYVLLRDVNDSIEDAYQLYKYTKHLSSKVNIIEYNAVEGLEFKKSSFEKTEKFIGYLLKKGVNVSLRRSRGKDINAACGQLANKN